MVVRCTCTSSGGAQSRPLDGGHTCDGTVEEHPYARLDPVGGGA